MMNIIAYYTKWASLTRSPPKKIKENGSKQGEIDK